MEIIVNSKSLANGINVIQLETAVGAAMKSFEGGLGKSSTHINIAATAAYTIILSLFYTCCNRMV
jgi:UTP--glucose-1-phosphate uridylyltransferase